MPQSVPILTRATLSGLTVAMLLLSLLPWFVTSEASRQQLYADEAGLLEQASVALWVMLAVALFFILRPTTWCVTGAAFICLLAAAREASWHKTFTDYSVLKFGYYLDGSYPLTQRLLVGLVVCLGIFSLGSASLTLLRHYRDNASLRTAWVQLWLIFLAVGAGSKVLDRTPAISDESFGLVLPTMATEMMQSCEEGLEMLLPVLLCTTAFAFARARPARLTAKPTLPDAVA